MSKTKTIKAVHQLYSIALLEPEKAKQTDTVYLLFRRHHKYVGVYIQKPTQDQLNEYRPGKSFTINGEFTSKQFGEHVQWKSRNCKITDPTLEELQIDQIETDEFIKAYQEANYGVSKFHQNKLNDAQYQMD